MNIAHSIVCDEWLGKHIKERYEVPEATTCQYLRQGVNDSFLVNAVTKKYIFRIYRRLWRPLERISAEIDLLRQLELHSAPIAGVIADRSGELIQSIACPEGERYGILMPCAANTDKESHCIVAGNTFNYGQAAARLHNAMKRCHSPAGVTTIDTDHLIWKPLTLVERVFAEHKDELRYLHHFAQQLTQQIDGLGNQASRSLIHADLTGGNACIDAKCNFVFFDFDCCGYGWTAYDLAVFLWSAILNKKEKALWPEFISGYQSETHIEESDLALIPLLAAARNFWIMGYSIDQVGFRGKSSYTDRHFARDIEFFKLWEGRLP